jgi:signal transduction histidine kinase/Fe-S-cluster-containing hydrogenase component 2
MAIPLQAAISGDALATQLAHPRYGIADNDSSAVFTVAERCKKCYSCVRTCPTKAIQVREGQAQIIPSACISCGYCVAACSQGAKMIRSSLNNVVTLLESSTPCFVMVAPSFPAAYPELEPQQMAGALVACGFQRVYEVAFGADLVSYEYSRRYRDLEADSGGFLISSPCPVVVSYVEKICPALTSHLAEVVSPMEAMAIVIRKRLVPAGTAQPSLVFIGPCVAKKDEAHRLGLVDSVLTFDELSDLFTLRGVDPGHTEARDFDPPRANLGRLYPVPGGLLKASGVDNDLLESAVSTEEGSGRVADLLLELAHSKCSGQPIATRLFDLLFCEGCIDGPALTNDMTLYDRKKAIVSYIKAGQVTTDLQRWAEEHAEFLDLDLSKKFTACQYLEQEVPEEKIRAILARTGKLQVADELNCRACGYESCRDKAIAVYHGIAEVDMCLPYMISRLEQSIIDLKESQNRLIQAEKLASMGQMAAGIAHELNNPLGVVLMYSHLLMEKVKTNFDEHSLGDVERIAHEAERARTIVQGILDFSRKNRLELRTTDINDLIRQAAHDVASLEEAATIRIKLGLDESLKAQHVDPSQLRQVLDNLLKNAVEAMADGGIITIESEQMDAAIRIRASDSGPGIPEEILPHLFTPFHTTKRIGKGTGLGLAVCYGIIKMHSGSIRAFNQPGGGACFEICLPSDTGDGETGLGRDTHGEG